MYDRNMKFIILYNDCCWMETYSKHYKKIEDSVCTQQLASLYPFWTYCANIGKVTTFDVGIIIAVVTLMQMYRTLHNTLLRFD